MKCNRRRVYTKVTENIRKYYQREKSKMHTHKITVNPFSYGKIKFKNFEPGKKHKLNVWNKTICLNAQRISSIESNIARRNGRSFSITNNKIRLIDAHTAHELESFASNTLSRQMVMFLPYAQTTSHLKLVPRHKI